MESLPLAGLHFIYLLLKRLIDLDREIDSLQSRVLRSLCQFMNQSPNIYGAMWRPDTHGLRVSINGNESRKTAVYIVSTSTVKKKKKC